MENIIRVTGDLNYDEWIVEDFTINPVKTYLQIGFRSLVHGESYVEFNNLKFGFFLYDTEYNVLQYSSYPKVGTNYHNTDQSYLEQIELDVKINRQYKLHIWAEDAGKFYDYKIDLNIPKYTKPYPSWIWNTELEQWDSPVLYPQDGNFYKWNEELLEWNFVDTSEEYSDDMNVVVSEPCPSNIQIL